MIAGRHDFEIVTVDVWEPKHLPRTLEIDARSPLDALLRWCDRFAWRIARQDFSYPPEAEQATVRPGDNGPERVTVTVIPLNITPVPMPRDGFDAHIGIYRIVTRP